jgi:hypothetical protein
MQKKEKQEVDRAINQERSEAIRKQKAEAKLRSEAIKNAQQQKYCTSIQT